MIIFILIIWVLSLVQHVAFMIHSNGEPGSNFHQFTLYFPLWHLNTFLFGMLAGLYIKKMMRRDDPSYVVPRIAYVLGGVLFLLILFINNPVKPFISSGFLSPIFFLIIAGLALDNSMVTRLLGGKFLVLLGNASYSVYILQCPIWIVFCFVLKTKTFNTLEFNIYLLTLIVISILVYLFFEKNAKNYLIKKWSSHQSSNTMDTKQGIL